MQARTTNHLRGIDVSHHQGLIDWLNVKTDDVHYAFVKATDGIGYTDPNFRRNAGGAFAVNIPVGFYHYARPESNTAKVEAEAFIAATKGLHVDLPYVLDLEGKAVVLGLDKVTQWAVDWLTTVHKQTGHSVMLYTSADVAKNFCGIALGQFPLWVAHYGAPSPLANSTWDTWSIFQYSDHGSIKGIVGPVDINAAEPAFISQFVRKEEGTMSKYPLPTMIKERIYVENGVLKFCNGDYSKRATDVRFIKLLKGTFALDLANEKGGRVSKLGPKYKADLATQFPYFIRETGDLIGTNYGQGKKWSTGYGKTDKWHELAFVNGEMVIGQLPAEVPGLTMRTQGSPLLIEEGRLVYNMYAAQEETAPDIKNGICQRTFVGVDREGNGLMAWADGDTSSDKGLDLEEMGKYLLSKGAWYAINGDGHSSTIVVDKYGTGLNQRQNTGVNEAITNHALLVYMLEEKPPMPKSDTDSHWAKANIERVKAEGIMTGYDDGTFKPDQPMTRAEVATVICNLIDKGWLKK